MIRSIVAIGAHHAAVIVKNTRHEGGKVRAHARYLLLAVSSAPARSTRKERHGHEPAIRARRCAVERHYSMFRRFAAL